MNDESNHRTSAVDIGGGEMRQERDLIIKEPFWRYVVE